MISKGLQIEDVGTLNLSISDVNHEEDFYCSDSDLSYQTLGSKLEISLIDDSS